MSIVQNKKAYHDYFIEERLETGRARKGLEVNEIREAHVHTKEAKDLVKNDPRNHSR